MRIVVTGASGYIGARLCKNLAEMGHEIVAVYRKIGPKGESWKTRPTQSSSAGSFEDSGMRAD